jgi:sialic acid synthase SpsE
MKFFKDPFIISEIGINHNGNLSNAFKLIDSSIRAGASAVKFQTYKTEKRVKKNSPIFNILKKCELNNDDFIKIKKYCDKKKIIFFSTPFDVESVYFLEKLKVKLFKVASFDIANYEILNAIIKTKIPTILSTGMATKIEIDKAYNLFKKKNISLAFLHCVSNYPNNETTSYLSCIEYLKKRYDCPIGLSDHTNDIKIARYGYLMGAKIIEKHFTTDSQYKCVDKPVSINEKQMKQLINEIEYLKKIIGTPKFGQRPEEKNTLKYKNVKKK